MSYAEKLKDPRWQKKRLEVLENARWRCEDCQRPDKTLEVHHCAYIRIKSPWEYDLNLLMALCGDCHQYRQGREEAMRVALGMMTRHMHPSKLEDEAWALLQDVRLRETERYAKTFGGEP